jgi:predicted alpha/beta hydrolase family esterase
VLAATSPVVLAAHSLGCILVAAWAAHSRNTHKVRRRLLVAPGDVERDDLRQQIPGWAPIVRQRCRFRRCWSPPRRPYCEFERSRQLASDWGAQFMDAGARGHLNAESGLGDWPEGRVLLKDL